MPMFGISKTEAQKLIAAEATARITADEQINATISGIATNIVNERQERIVADAALDLRLTALEGGTPPPPSPAPIPPTAHITIDAVLLVDTGRALVQLHGESSEPPERWHYSSDDPTAIPLGIDAFYVGRGPQPRNVAFLLSVTKPHYPVAQDSVVAVIPPLDIIPPPPPPPPPEVFERVVLASEFTITGPTQTIAFATDHFENWGHPGEGITVTVHADAPTVCLLDFDYVLARESDDTSSRETALGSYYAIAQFPATCDLWTVPVHGWSLPVRVDVPAGDTALVVEVPVDSPDWSNWLDLYAMRIKSDQPVTVGGITPPSTPEPPPSSGTLDTVLSALFPHNGPVLDVQWGQAVSTATVLPGSTLRYAGTVHGGDYILLGLKGTADNWIKLDLVSLNVLDVATFRGLGLYGCEYVHCDGGIFTGSGADFASAVEACGGHHVAVTRATATNCGGHCVSGTWNEGMGIDRAPANMFIGWNRAIETSKRNPWNGSAFNIFHPATGQPWGPLAHLGVTDYVVGNVAFGCESDVAAGSWGITDGNCVIIDQGDEVQYAGTVLCAFNVGADNGGRGVHELNSNGLWAVFNTMVGNQRNVAEPASGEFSPHGGINERVQGNIAAATTRTPAYWYQQWQGGTPHTVSENVILAGTSDAPYDVPLTPGGLAYLRGGTTKSRDAADYRPVVGTPLSSPELVAIFNDISHAFPEVTGGWRTSPIAGALD